MIYFKLVVNLALPSRLIYTKRYTPDIAYSSNLSAQCNHNYQSKKWPAFFIYKIVIRKNTYSIVAPKENIPIPRNIKTNV